MPTWLSGTHQGCIKMTAYLWNPSETNIFHLHSPQDKTSISVFKLGSETLRKLAKITQPGKYLKQASLTAEPTS